LRGCGRYLIAPSANSFPLDDIARHIQQFRGRFVARATAVVEIIGQAGLDVALIGKLDQLKQFNHSGGRHGGHSLKHVGFLLVDGWMMDKLLGISSTGGMQPSCQIDYFAHRRFTAS